jgi:Tol biopolymer transport system component
MRYILMLGVAALAGAQTVGIFENHADVGAILHKGSAEYDEAKKSYLLAGSGDNMWSTTDAFQFAWKRISGDVTLAADISFIGAGGVPHRKAVLMIRQSLDADSPYADAVLHGDGMTALQARDEKGAITYQVQAGVKGPKRLSIRKIGKYFYLSVAGVGEDLHLAGASMRVALQEPFYVGLGVCSHDKDAMESAVFSNVELSNKPPTLYSSLETITVGSAPVERRIVYTAPGRFEAPNWTRDGKWLLFNGGGRLQRISPDGGKPEFVDTGFATRLNNDHGLSPDGAQLAISDQSQGQHRSTIYILPLAGGTPRQITKGETSDYWHGWSPDGKTLAYTGLRNDNWDIYTIPVAGGEEKRLTTAAATDDGPEYSPDGAYIYFNSARSGWMQIWRMKPDGSEQEQVTNDEYNNWFPHFSPDGQRIVFVSFEKDVVGHPENKDVTLRMMTMNDKKITVLAKLFGGQGTINVPSWSPDGKRVAFVSYELIP